MERMQKCLKLMIRSGSGDSSSTIPEGNGLVFGSIFIPPEVLCHILSFVEPHSLTFSCRRVCRIWRDSIDNDVWKLKIRRLRDNELSSFSRLNAADRARSRLPWYVYSVIFRADPFHKNLLKNNCGQDAFNYWSITEPTSRRNGEWGYEGIPVGCFPLPQSEDFGNNTGCFVTSYYKCSKYQIVDLHKEGIFVHLLNELQPTITASEWYAGRFDCGCRYTLKVGLFDKRMQLISEKEKTEYVKQWEGNEWHKVTIVFENYGPGVRFIRFQHEGQDTKFWAGYYGSKMSGGVVTVSLPRNLELDSSLSSSENTQPDD